MTVAAIILAADPESALADADGLPSVRRIAEAAWSGGATPVVVVSQDPDGAMARALAGAEATIVRGIDVAVGMVGGTDAALLWPVRMAWVGPETVTSLIEAHGADPTALLRPAYAGEPGWPVLLPAIHLARLLSVAADTSPDAIVADVIADGSSARTLDLGDPGATIDVDTPRADLPPYDGPAPDPSHVAREWGADVADRPEG